MVYLMNLVDFNYQHLLNLEKIDIKMDINLDPIHEIVINVNKIQPC